MEVTNNISRINYQDTTIEYGDKPQAVKTGNKTSVNKPTKTPGVFHSSAIKSDSKGVEEISESVAKAVITEINKKINRNTTAQFSFHEKTNRVMIKIMDSETNEVIKEIPPEKTLDMVAKILELVGLLVDDKR